MKVVHISASEDCALNPFSGVKKSSVEHINTAIRDLKLPSPWAWLKVRPAVLCCSRSLLLLAFLDHYRYCFL